MDRFFDLYIGGPQQKMVYDALRKPEDRDPRAVPDAKAGFDKAYAWLDKRLEGRTWPAGDQFTMTDCAAATQLLYADWTYEIDKGLKTLWAYRTRLLARPMRHYFPLGAPDRD